MPNVGRPSRDCHTCRKRRVKCDLVRPQCNRCLNLGKTCPGYRDESTVHFRVQNVSSFPAVMARDNRRRRTPENAPVVGQQTRGSAEGLEHPVACTDSARSQNLTSDPLSLDQHVPLPILVDKSLKFDTTPSIPSKIVADNNVSSTRSGADLRETRDVLISIGRIITQADCSSPIYAVCKAIALAYITSETRSKTADLFRAHVCRSAIAAINAAFDNRQPQSRDSTLFAVWMFNFYEFLTSHRVNSSDESERTVNFCQGVAQIIRQRGPERFLRQDGQNLVWYVCYCLLYKSLVAEREPSGDITIWLLSIYEHSNSSDRLLIRAFIYVYHCTCLSSRILNLLQTDDLQRRSHGASSIIEAIDSLEEDTGPISDPSIKEYRVPPPLASLPCLEPGRMTLQEMTLYAYQCTYRMHISHIAMKLFHNASQAPGCPLTQHTLFKQRHDQCMWEFWALADRVLGLFMQDNVASNDENSISRLGWLDAMMMSGSLRMIYETDLSLSWQREMAGERLRSFREHLAIACPVL